MKRSGPPKRKTPLAAKSGLKASGENSLRVSPLSARSAKRAKVYAEERVPLVKRLLSERPWCEACPVWAAHDGLHTFQQRPSQDVHEVLTRGRGGSILDEANLLCVCRPCHDRIGREPALSNDLGLTKSSWD